MLVVIICQVLNHVCLSSPTDLVQELVKLLRESGDELNEKVTHPSQKATLKKLLRLHFLLCPGGGTVIMDNGGLSVASVLLSSSLN